MASNGYVERFRECLSFKNVYINITVGPTELTDVASLLLFSCKQFCYATILVIFLSFLSLLESPVFVKKFRLNLIWVLQPGVLAVTNTLPVSRLGTGGKNHRLVTPRGWILGAQSEVMSIHKVIKYPISFVKSMLTSIQHQDVFLSYIHESLFFVSCQ